MSLSGSSTAAVRLNQSADGGANPTLPLHSLVVAECKVADIQGIIEREHYSHSIFGVTTDVCFSVSSGDTIVGGAIFGRPAGVGVAEKYGERGRFKITELRRFILIQECERNSESRVLAVMLRNLRKKGYQRILSYADPAHGHQGVIYRASGFEYHGTTNARKHVMWKGKKYPDRNIHQVNFPFHLELRAALDNGTATRVKIPGKHIYVKTL